VCLCTFFFAILHNITGLIKMYIIIRTNDEVIDIV
jgi:hypothetical protein